MSTTKGTIINMREGDISLRRFKEQEAKKVSSIIQNNLLQINSKDYPEKVINKMCETFTPGYIIKMSKQRKMYVALIGDMIVGTASIEDDTIYTVFVDVKYHGKGIGEKLISLLEEIAANNGIQLVKLPASITALKFYERLGYCAVSEVESEEFGKDIIMEKYLV
ncbi:MAG: GNAT family N-acetyltransferase [Lutisporaceae bacterium]